MRKHASLLLIALLIALAPVQAQTPPATVTVAGNLYRGDGSGASGTVRISWRDFVTADGKSVAAGQKEVVIGTGGSVSVALVPNIGATPAGTYYTVKIFAGMGTPYNEYWIVPATNATLEQVRVPSVGPVTTIQPVAAGGTGAQSFTPLNCIQANADGSKLVSASAPCGSGGGMVTKHAPIEICDNNLQTFTFAAVPGSADAFNLFWNGLSMAAVDDYTYNSSGSIFLLRPCKTGDHLFAYY